MNQSPEERSAIASVGDQVVRHYTHGSLERAIFAALAQTGEASPAALVERLAAVDEFHIGGRQATTDLMDQLDLRPGLQVVDIGCGLGGTARVLAARYGCRVAGIDLTPEYVAVGQALNTRLGLDGRIELGVASATDLPFEDVSADRVTVLHVGMNVPDKRGLCQEIARVLKPGGLLGLYDVMRMGRGGLQYPVPWAQAEAWSFVGTPAEYRDALTAAGFHLMSERNRGDFALEFFRAMRARMAESGPPPLGLHILMGAEAPVKLANMVANLASGTIAPVEMIARRG